MYRSGHILAIQIVLWIAGARFVFKYCVVLLWFGNMNVGDVHRSQHNFQMLIGFLFALHILESIWTCWFARKSGLRPEDVRSAFQQPISFYKHITQRLWEALRLLGATCCYNWIDIFC